MLLLPPLNTPASPRYLRLCSQATAQTEMYRRMHNKHRETPRLRQKLQKTKADGLMRGRRATERIQEERRQQESCWGGAWTCPASLTQQMKTPRGRGVSACLHVCSHGRCEPARSLMSNAVKELSSNEASHPPPNPPIREVTGSTHEAC